MRKTRAATPRPSLAIERSASTSPLPTPPSRGRLWYDFQIVDEFLGGLPLIKDQKNRIQWVRDHLPRASRIKIGNASCWYERDVLAWIESQREAERLKAMEEAS
jgi:hypothetical protein